MPEPDTADQGCRGHLSGPTPQATQQSGVDLPPQPESVEQGTADQVLPVSGFLPIPQHLLK